MFKFKSTLLIAVMLLCVLPFAYTQKDTKEQVIDGFTVYKITRNTARVRIKSGEKYVPLEINKVYKFPVTLKSNSAQIFIEFSANNTARLLPNTVLQLSSPEMKHPKLKLLKGNVALTLDKFPKDHKIEVSTPTAVCGAVGTRFEVSYSGEDKQLGIDKAKSTQKQTFACTKGEIFVASNGFHIGGVKKGQAVTTQNHEGKENSYSSVILDNKENNSFHIKLPDKSHYVSTATSFEIAQPKNQKKGEEIAVIKVNDDKLETVGFFETVKTDVEKGKAHVKVGDKYIAHNDSGAYLDAAKEEGRLDTRIKEVDLEMALLADVDKKTLTQEKEVLTEKRDIAAKKASALAKKIMADQNIRRHIQNLRRHINRQQMRNIKR